MATPEELEKFKAGQAMIRAVFEDQEAEINGRAYKMTRMTHKQRRKVFAFYTRVGKQVETGDMSFIDSAEFEPVEKVINSVITYNDSLLSILGDAHWEKYPDDYVTFIMTMLPAISFPFLPAVPTD